MEWEGTFLGYEPRWTRQPDLQAIERLSRRNLDIPDARRCDVRFLTQGGFNKIYILSTSEHEYIMRVSIPVYANYKTQSEVATLDFVRRRTTIPVPKVIAYDSTSDNELGYEWMLMEKMPGRPLRQVWRNMSMYSKEKLTRDLAGYILQLYLPENRFDAIGSIYLTTDSGSVRAEQSRSDHGLPRYHLGRMVSHAFFWGPHVDKTVQPGPFKSSIDWWESLLMLARSNTKHVLCSTDDEDEVDVALRSNEIIGLLRIILSHLSAENQDSDMTSVLWHDDLSQQNILVDDKGRMTAILDWECVSALPAWKFFQPPILLSGKVREREPNPADYADEDAEDKRNATDSEEYELDNKGKSSLYWEHLLEYEQTRLRSIYWEKLRTLHLDLEEQPQHLKLVEDVESAVKHCDSELAGRSILRWLNALFQQNLDIRRAVNQPRLREYLRF